ncbi:MAG: response regulator [Clostridiaceae bacterium]|jgi:DNA-binding NtrC family response regulator|nr:response regulator [Clostridiaceae bacterium]
MKKIKIAIVDDDPIFLEIIKEKLNHYEISCFSNSKDALKGIKGSRFDIAILDFIIDEMNGQQLVQEIRKFNQSIYIILLTGQVKLPGITLVRETDIQDYVEKNSGNFDELILRVESAVKSLLLAKKREDKTKESFSIRLKELRTIYNISQSDLASYLDLNRAQVSNYEKGISKPSLDIIEKIADYFGVSIDYLLCRSINYLGALEDMKHK